MPREKALDQVIVLLERIINMLLQIEIRVGAHSTELKAIEEDIQTLTITIDAQAKILQQILDEFTTTEAVSATLVITPNP